MQIGVGSERAVDNRRIYVIDEDEVARTALQFMLADDNETHEFASLASAQAHARDWPPDLLLLGETLLSGGALELDEGLARAKVLLVGQPATTLPAGCIGLVSKPLRLEAVRACVDRALGRGGSQ